MSLISTKGLKDYNLKKDSHKTLEIKKKDSIKQLEKELTSPVVKPKVSLIRQQKNSKLDILKIDSHKTLDIKKEDSIKQLEKQVTKPKLSIIKLFKLLDQKWATWNG